MSVRIIVQCAQLFYTIQHRTGTGMTIFLPNLETIIKARMLFNDAV